MSKLFSTRSVAVCDQANFARLWVHQASYISIDYCWLSYNQRFFCFAGAGKSTLLNILSGYKWVHIYYLAFIAINSHSTTSVTSITVKWTLKRNALTTESLVTCTDKIGIKFPLYSLLPRIGKMCALFQCFWMIKIVRIMPEMREWKSQNCLNWTSTLVVNLYHHRLKMKNELIRNWFWNLIIFSGSCHDVIELWSPCLMSKFNFLLHILLEE